MKPEHIIISEDDTKRIKEIGSAQGYRRSSKQIEFLYQLLNDGNYSVIDYELLSRTPEHEDAVKSSRRHSYLDDQLNRFTPTPLPSHLSYKEIFGVPYIYGHAESTGGRLWVVGKKCASVRLFSA